MIPGRQNEPEGQKLLKARQQLWHQAQRVLVLQLVLTVLVPVAAAVIGIFYQEARPIIALVALAISITDAALLDRHYRVLIKKAARASEEFDCFVLEIPWNEFVVGKKLDPEFVHAQAKAFDRRSDDSKLADWYAPAVAELPAPFARILCQRTNLWYDATLRNRYSGAIPVGLLVTSVTLLLVGLVMQFSLVDFVLTIVAPMAPVSNWSLREFFRQRDTAAAQETAKGNAEAFWSKALAGTISEPEIENTSREFQDSIFMRRASSPLLPPGIYWAARSSMEDDMNVGAETLVKDYVERRDRTNAECARH